MYYRLKYKQTNKQQNKIKKYFGGLHKTLQSYFTKTLKLMWHNYRTFFLNLIDQKIYYVQLFVTHNYKYVRNREATQEIES